MKEGRSQAFKEAYIQGGIVLLILQLDQFVVDIVESSRVVVDISAGGKGEFIPAFEHITQNGLGLRFELST